MITKEIAEIVYYVLKNKSNFNNKFKGQLLGHKKSLQWQRITSPYTKLISSLAIVQLDWATTRMPIKYLVSSRY